MNKKLADWIDNNPWPSCAIFAIFTVIATSGLTLFFDYLERLAK